MTQSQGNNDAYLEDCRRAVCAARRRCLHGGELLAAPFDKPWAFSGVIGASKGIKSLEQETAAAAATVARAKGWEPPPTPK